MKYFGILILIMNSIYAFSQDKPYYYEIPANPESYSAANVAARMVDGVGFRYFWATEGLRKEDLEWSPGEKSRSSFNTLEHIMGLTSVLLNAVRQVPNENNANPTPLTYEEMRAKTLDNLKQSSDILKMADADLNKYKMIFKNGERTNEFPFWNLVNGPIADALWHIGQVVSFRRSSGNPLPNGVSVLQGIKRD
ncbi:MAG: hypothetical protein ABI844_16540 [Saprospiraceae bacterium]